MSALVIYSAISAGTSRRTSDSFCMSLLTESNARFWSPDDRYRSAPRILLSSRAAISSSDAVSVPFFVM